MRIPASTAIWARSYLAERTPGLRIQVANAGTAAYRVELEGPRRLQVRLKALASPCARASLAHGWKAELEVPPGCAFPLSLEGSRKENLSVEVSLAGEPAAAGSTFAVELDLMALETTQVIGYDGERWRLAETSEPPEIGLAFFWKEPEVPLENEAGDVDEALRRQLEALGYVE